MKQYLITATEIKNYSVVVVAEDEASAMLTAESIPMEEFDHVGGEFTIDYADPYDEEN